MSIETLVQFKWTQKSPNFTFVLQCISKYIIQFNSHFCVRLSLEVNEIILTSLTRKANAPARPAHKPLDALITWLFIVELIRDTCSTTMCDKVMCGGHVHRSTLRLSPSGVTCFTANSTLTFKFTPEFVERWVKTGTLILEIIISLINVT